jgi:hypothetical protein
VTFSECGSRFEVSSRNAERLREVLRGLRTAHPLIDPGDLGATPDQLADFDATADGVRAPRRSPSRPVARTCCGCAREILFLQSIVLLPEMINGRPVHFRIDGYISPRRVELPFPGCKPVHGQPYRVVAINQLKAGGRLTYEIAIDFNVGPGIRF